MPRPFRNRRASDLRAWRARAAPAAACPLAGNAAPIRQPAHRLGSAALVPFADARQILLVEMEVGSANRMSSQRRQWRPGVRSSPGHADQMASSHRAVPATFPRRRQDRCLAEPAMRGGVRSSVVTVMKLTVEHEEPVAAHSSDGSRSNRARRKTRDHQRAHERLELLTVQRLDTPPHVRRSPPGHAGHGHSSSV